jgi:pimeloyl-ACP methyl ester carboxylesterase
MDQSKRMNVYFISGLGADERVFANLKLPSFCTPQYLQWIPFEKDESLTYYSHRLAADIDTSKPFVVIGLSLGGMIASEIQSLLSPLKTILISSASSNKQLPFYFSLGRVLPLHRWIPLRWQFKWRRAAYWFIGVQTEEDKRLFKALLKVADPVFMERATDAVIRWTKKEATNDLVHIHGTSDHILPIQFVQPTHIIKDGTHLMVFNRAEEVSKILEEVLSEVYNSHFS